MNKRSAKVFNFGNSRRNQRIHRGFERSNSETVS